MVRPLKGRKRVMVRGFCYPGEYDEFFDKLSLSLAADHKTLSDYLLQVSLEDSKKRYPKIGASEYLKEIQERQKALAEAEGEEVRMAIEDLRSAMRTYPKDPRLRHEEITKKLKKHQPLYIRTRSKDLNACMDEARSLLDKIVEEARRVH